MRACCANCNSVVATNATNAYSRAMTELQKAAQSAIARAGNIRKAAGILGIDHTTLYRIATGERRSVSARTAAALGFELVAPRLRRL